MPLGPVIGEVLFPDSGKSVFKGQKSHQEGGRVSAQQTKANVSRTETPVTSEQVWQGLASESSCVMWSVMPAQNCSEMERRN